MVPRCIVVAVRSAGVGLALLGFSVALAQSGGDTMERQDNEPKVWTKEDLERMFGPSDPGLTLGQAVSDPAAERAFVESFLDRQYRRIDEEKQRELRREEIEAVYPEREPRYTLGLAPRLGCGWWWPKYGCGIGPGRPRAGSGGTGFEQSARQVNPFGSPVGASARAVNPANRR
jgi:hypothetical protein